MMRYAEHRYASDLLHCKCGLCNHSDRSECISGRCYCCDLEDAFAILTHHEFEPQSKLATGDRLHDTLAA